MIYRSSRIFFIAPIPLCNATLHNHKCIRCIFFSIMKHGLCAQYTLCTANDIFWGGGEGGGMLNLFRNKKHSWKRFYFFHSSAWLLMMNKRQNYTDYFVVWTCSRCRYILVRVIDTRSSSDAGIDNLDKCRPKKNHGVVFWRFIPYEIEFRYIHIVYGVIHKSR